jgi:hypothetical protein
MRTGNCWNGRHHTCKGSGTHSGKTGESVSYQCDCDCHNWEDLKDIMKEVSETQQANTEEVKQNV